MFLFLLSSALLYYLLYHVLKLSPTRGVAGCGLFGFNGRLAADETKIRWLAVENQSRGMHSTGVFTVSLDKHSTRTLAKDAVQAKNFIHTTEFKQAVRGAGQIIGHTRAATVGVVSKANAHPFLFPEADNEAQRGWEQVVGAHNGFAIQEIARSKFVGKDKDFEKEFDVDSMLIFALLAKHGGDFKILSEIEGAITVAFAVPDKYPGVTYLYARSARNLHIGKAKEGIYYSSEEEPLKFIGCSNIMQINNCQLVLLKNGEILDVVDTSPPKIKSIALNATRFNYLDTVPTEEVSDFPEISYKITNFNKHKNWGKIPDRTFQAESQLEVFKKEEKVGAAYYNKKDEIHEVMRGLIMDVEADVKSSGVQTITSYKKSETYEISDIEACILVVKLESSVDSAPLPGFLIYDTENQEIGGITMLSGTTVLKFPPGDCEVRRTIRMSEPVDNTKCHEINITPKKGRVMEVTLQLPFQAFNEKKQIRASGDTNKVGINKGTDILKLGQSQLDILPADSELHEGNGCNTERVFDYLRKESGQLHRGSESLQERLTKILEVEEGTGNEGCPLSEIESSPRRHAQSTLPTKLSAGIIAAIIAEENKTFKYKKEIKSFMNCTEYMRFSKIVQDALGTIIKMSILHDAAVLKHHDKELTGNCYAIGVYVTNLLNLRREAYSIGDRLSSIDHVRIDQFISNLSIGKVPNQEVSSAVGKPEVSLKFMGLNPYHEMRFGYQPTSWPLN